MKNSFKKFCSIPPAVESSVLTGLFVILLAVPVIWAWNCPVLPLQDLPNHLANSVILSKYASEPFFQDYFTLELFPYPYLFQDIVLRLFMPFGPDAAARMLVSLVILSIPLSLVFLLRTVNPGKLYLAFFSLPLVWNKEFFKGCLNGLMGIPVTLVCLALLWKICFGSGNRKTQLAFSLSLLVLWFVHLAAFALFLLTALAVIAYWFGSGKARVKKPVFLWTFLPAVFVAVLTYSAHPIQADALSRAGLSLIDCHGKFALIRDMIVCFSQEEWRILRPMLVCLVFLIVSSLPEFKNNPLPFVLPGILFFIYFLAPRGIGALVGLLNRIFFLMLFTAPLACLNRRFLRWEKLVVVLLCTITALRFDAYIFRTTAAISPVMKGARSLMQQLPERKRLYPICGVSPYAGQIGIGLHIQAYYVIDRTGYVPSLFSTDYMLVRTKEKGAYSFDPGRINIEKLRTFDYIFVWGDNTRMEGELKKIDFAPMVRDGGLGIYQRTKKDFHTS